jgi:hypothetical protein
MRVRDHYAIQKRGGSLAQERPVRQMTNAWYEAVGRIVIRREGRKPDSSQLVISARTEGFSC